MTLFGQPVFGMGIAGLIALHGWYVQDFALIAAACVAVAALLLSSGVKWIVKRPRPNTVYARSMYFKTYSLPSGHAASAASCFMLFDYLCLASGNPLYMTVGAILLPLIIAIGISRVYLGAHYPSDIVIGWICGGIGLIAAIFLLHM